MDSLGKKNNFLHVRISDDVMEKIRFLASKHKWTMSSTALILIEIGLSHFHRDYAAQLVANLSIEQKIKFFENYGYLLGNSEEVSNDA